MNKHAPHVLWRHFYPQNEQKPLFMSCDVTTTKKTLLSFIAYYQNETTLHNLLTNFTKT